MKRARILAPGECVVEEAPRPEPRPGEALLRSLRVGVCGSDAHAYAGDNPLCRYPIVPGHEAACRVEEVNCAESPLSPGDLVVLEPLRRCGQCYPCRLGRYNCCERLQVIGVHADGAMSERFCMETSLLHRVPTDLPASLAALVEPAAIGCQAVRRGRVDEQDAVVVIGAGPIGLLTALIARSRGARVGVWEIRPDRLERAARLDFAPAINPHEGDPVRRTLDALGEPPSVVIDAAGQGEAIRLAIETARPAGRVVLVGLREGDAAFRHVCVIRKELDVLGSRNSAGLFPEAIAFVDAHRETLQSLITHELPLSAIERGLQLTRDKPPGVMKVMVRLA